MEGVACYDSDSDSNNDNANEGQKRNESKGLVQKWLEEEGEDEDEEGDSTKDIVNSNSSSSSSNSSLSVDALFNGDTSKESKFLHTIAGKDEFKIPQFKQEESERVCTTGLSSKFIDKPTAETSMIKQRNQTSNEPNVGKTSSEESRERKRAQRGLW